MSNYGGEIRIVVMYTLALSFTRHWMQQAFWLWRLAYDPASWLTADRHSPAAFNARTDAFWGHVRVSRLGSVHGVH